MKTTWDILQKELATLGFKARDNGSIEYKSQGMDKVVLVEDAIQMICSEIKENVRLLDELMSSAIKLLKEKDNQSIKKMPTDSSLSKLFIASVKSLAKFISCFQAGSKIKTYVSEIKSILDSDIAYYTSKQMNDFVDYQITIDWTHRTISKLVYSKKVLKFFAMGKNSVIGQKISIARGVSGPWANLDLPMGERMWSWKDEDENMRGRESDIRNQERYRKGLEEYNNDGRVGEGHYWREIKNEPYLWEDRDEESPYPGRSSFWN